jgi:hypothetical protein
MNVLKAIKAWIGFAYDIWQIIHLREYDEPDTPPDDDDGEHVPTTPVVHVSPDASAMISRPKLVPVPAIDEPLEGSIEARQRALNLR